MGTGTEAGRDTSGARARARVILFCAPVTLLFTFADVMALGRFSWLAFLVRGAWAGLIVAVALTLPHASPRAERLLILGLAVASVLFFAALTKITGGNRSPLFHWILAVPLTIAVVVQDHPRAVLAAGVVTVACGVAILARAAAGPALEVEWAVQAAGMSALAVYASATYRRLRAREAELMQSGRQAAARVRASELALAARDDFLAVAAHELRTPLTSLLLQIDTALKPLGAEEVAPAAIVEPTRRRLEIIARQAKRLAALVESMLDVSRLARERLTLNYANTDLGAVVRDVVLRLAPDAAAARCPVTLDLAEPLHGRWDPDRLDQVVTNLVANAIKYGAGAPIRVVATGDDRQVRLSVRDQGIGISPADHQRIFERFERAVSPHNYGGLGLGLWIVRRIVEAFGGSVQVESTPGQGSLFTVELPRVV